MKLDVQMGVPLDSLLDDVPKSEYTNLSTWLRSFVSDSINSHSTHEGTILAW